MMQRGDIEWTRLSGRRWQATIWRPGEREQVERQREAFQLYAQAQMQSTAPYYSGYGGVCPCCGQARHTLGSALGLGGLVG